ncbi:MAG: DUF6565 domain-containing protein [Bacteroidota bacterium]
MKLAIKFFLIMVLAVGTSSCLIPSSKERYLANFERFVKNVENDAENFKPRDWRWADKRYRRYSDEWYQRFKPELTLQEQIRIAGYKLRYQAMKQGSGVKRLIDEQLSKDIDKIGDDVGKYLDENLDRDLERLSKGAREIGDSAKKVVEDLLKEIRKNK